MASIIIFFSNKKTNFDNENNKLPFDILILNRDCSINKCYLNIDVNDNIRTELPFSFVPYDDVFYMFRYFDNNVYKFSGDSVSIKYKLNFLDKNIPNNLLHSVESQEDIEKSKIPENYFETLFNYFETNSFCYMYVSHEQELTHCLFNKNDRSVKCFSGFVDDILGLPLQNLTYINNNKAIVTLDASVAKTITYDTKKTDFWDGMRLYCKQVDIDYDRMVKAIKRRISILENYDIDSGNNPLIITLYLR